MKEILDALEEQHRELEALLARLDDHEWATPVPRCPGWSVADVVLHLAQTDELAAASARGDLADAPHPLSAGSADVDTGAAAAVDSQRGVPPPELLERWRAATSATRSTLAATDPEVRLPWVTNTLAPATLATTRLAEAWIHTGDIADALHAATTTSPARLRHIAWLAWRTLPYAFARAGSELSGPVAVSLVAPDGDQWSFGERDAAATTVDGPADEWCLVAARRVDPSSTDLRAEGPDAESVLALVRTYA